MSTSKLKDLSAKKAAIASEVKALGRSAFAELFAEFFTAHPQVLAVRWRQYTPAFNDGEPCEFRVGEYTLKLLGSADDAGDDENGFTDSYESPPEAEAAFASADRIMREVDEDFFLFVFDNNVEVTVARDGISVEPYDCGY